MKSEWLNLLVHPPPAMTLTSHLRSLCLGFLISEM